jgi:precorrin-6B C5,15-methyltransferase / cobalt-precorrin-6B C5,C15-methyltransferase
MSAAADPWLSVVGIGAAGLQSLSSRARAVVEAGEVLVGGERHLAMVAGHPAERLVWRRPLEATLADLAALRGRRVVVLASGDPMWFGVGELLCRHFDRAELRVLPAPSTLSLICARLGWPQSAVHSLSLHGRPLAVLHRHLAPGARLVALSHDGETPNRIARALVERGFGPSRIWVFEHLDGTQERIVEDLAASWCPDGFAALNAVAIECAAEDWASVWSQASGLPDEVFSSDGMLTKREVRAATLARLAPLPGQRLWDVGAGSGSVAIEWLRAARHGHAIAIEQEPERCARITENAERLGTPELEVVCGRAPERLAGLPEPDAVFVGGGIGTPGLIELCWQSLRPRGRLVANVVTLEGERALLDWHARYGGELVRIAVSRIEPLGPHHVWRPLMPVTQLALEKR